MGNSIGAMVYSLSRFSRSFSYIKRYGFVAFLAKVLNVLSRRISQKRDVSRDVGLRFHLEDVFSMDPSTAGFLWENADPARFRGKKLFLLTDCDIRPEILRDAEVVRTTLNLSDDVVRSSVFYTYFLCDSDALPEIRRIIRCGGVLIPHLDATKTQYRFVNRHALDAILATIKHLERISHFDTTIHENICEALEITKDLDGDYVEIGVYRGGSALTALNYLRDLRDSKGANVDRKVWCLDTFDGFTYEAAYQSSDVIWNGTHRLDGVSETMNSIRETLSDVGLDFHLVETNICLDVLPTDIKKIAVANIDVDMYEPTRDSLSKVSPLMVRGGIIICEDPTSTPALYGALLAMEDFLASEEGRKYVKIFKFGQYFLIRSLD